MAGSGHFWLSPTVQTTQHALIERCASQLWFIDVHIGPLQLPLKRLVPFSWAAEETGPSVRRNTSWIERVLHICPFAGNLQMLIDLILSRAREAAIFQEQRMPIWTHLFCEFKVSMVYTVRLSHNKQIKKHINKKENKVYLISMAIYLFLTFYSICKV